MKITFFGAIITQQKSGYCKYFQKKTKHFKYFNLDMDLDI